MSAMDTNTVVDSHFMVVRSRKIYRKWFTVALICHIHFVRAALPIIRMNIQIKREIISVSAFRRHRSHNRRWITEYNARYHYRRHRWRINEIINNLVCVSTWHTAKMRSATFLPNGVFLFVYFFFVVVRCGTFFCQLALRACSIVCLHHFRCIYTRPTCLSFRMLHISLLCVWCVANERKLSMIRPINKIVPLNVCVRHFFFFFRCPHARRVLHSTIAIALVLLAFFAPPIRALPSLRKCAWLSQRNGNKFRTRFFSVLSVGVFSCFVQFFGQPFI